MINRRKFLKTTGLIGLGGLLAPGAYASLLRPSGHPIGVQLFTLFGVIENDVEGNLRKIAAIGYTEVESAFSRLPNYYGLEPAQFAALCARVGLSWKSHHVLGAPFHLPKGYKLPAGPDGKPMVIPVMKNLRDNMQELVDQAAAGGISYLVCANTPTSTLEEINSSIAVLNQTGAACKKAGIQFCYHNHDMEFVPVEGKIPYSMILEQTDADAVKMELDLAWATKAKVDVPALFSQHPGRFPLLHVKDISADFKTLEPVGSGVVDFKSAFAAAATGGVKEYFVEHDMPKDAYVSLNSSYRALRKMGI